MEGPYLFVRGVSTKQLDLWSWLECTNGAVPFAEWKVSDEAVRLGVGIPVRTGRMEKHPTRRPVPK